MNLACKVIICILIILIFAPPCFSETGKSDNWFGKDKLKHFAISTFYSGAIAVTANRHFDMDKSRSLKIGVGFTISLGAGKEIYDRTKPEETSSIKDFIWDIAGAITGAVIAGSIL